MAALQRGEALTQLPSETPPRAPVSDRPFRERGRVPRLFAEGYAGYLESCRGGAAEEACAGAAAEGPGAAVAGAGEEARVAGPARVPRLQVRPWHRSALQKMLCRAVLFHFLQDRREALGLQAGQPPLWLWEVRAAQEHSAAGQVEALVKYLAETELHIQEGPQRSTQWPGSTPQGAGAAQRLRAERRRLARDWGFSERELHEDAVVRVFLDGRLSWPAVRGLLGSPLKRQGSTMLGLPLGPAASN